MIEVDNVSMKFDLGIDKGGSLKQTFVNLFSGKKKQEEVKPSVTFEKSTYTCKEGENITTMVTAMPSDSYIEGIGVAYPGKEKTVGKDESHGVHLKKSEELPCVRQFTENL